MGFTGQGVYRSRTWGLVCKGFGQSSKKTMSLLSDLIRIVGQHVLKYWL